MRPPNQNGSKGRHANSSSLGEALSTHFFFIKRPLRILCKGILVYSFNTVFLLYSTYNPSRAHAVPSLICCSIRCKTGDESCSSYPKNLDETLRYQQNDALQIRIDIVREISKRWSRQRGRFDITITRGVRRIDMIIVAR
jgi:hypothetical protein